MDALTIALYGTRNGRWRVRKGRNVVLWFAFSPQGPGSRAFRTHAEALAYAVSGQ